MLRQGLLRVLPPENVAENRALRNATALREELRFNPRQQTHLLVQHIAEPGMERTLEPTHAVVVDVRGDDGGQGIAVNYTRLQMLRVENSGVVDPGLVVVEIGAVLGGLGETEGVVDVDEDVLHGHRVRPLSEQVLVHDAGEQAVLRVTASPRAHEEGVRRHGGAVLVVEA